ncbi:hypothetical protein [Anaerorhabdus furcosa]|uniref:Uncharacterized protein n=1 Tax=Anaerorhabdus furcosa TaxID=118967 RepID=A0A1T4K2S4_9FIRM|nr:hypothetical protein [Anaerorhabdus furcosa]SJZ36752.1 hypothetical protein SAMN02745191_0265 [Anaerorhabdus furcosa]
MKRIYLLLAIALFGFGVFNEKEITIDPNINQNQIATGITSLNYNDNLAYNIDNSVLAEIKLEFPYYCSQPTYFKEVNNGNFSDIPGLITIRINLYTKIGVQNESIELREYVLLKKDNIFSFDSLVGYQKIDEIADYSIFISNSYLDELAIPENFSLEEIRATLDQSISFYKISE